MVPQSLFSHLIFTFLKSEGQLFCWMSFNIGLSSFLMIKFRLCFLASISHSDGVFIQCIVSGDNIIFVYSIIVILTQPLGDDKGDDF